MFHLSIYEKKNASIKQQQKTQESPLHEGKQLPSPFPNIFIIFLLLASHPECITFHMSIAFCLPISSSFDLEE